MYDVNLPRRWMLGTIGVAGLVAAAPAFAQTAAPKKADPDATVPATERLMRENALKIFTKIPR